MHQLAAVRRGVEDPDRSAAFYSWLLGLDAHATPGEFRFACGNAEFVVAAAATPVAIGWISAQDDVSDVDPDGVPVTTSRVGNTEGSPGVVLDHVRLICGDLAASVAFYRRFGLRLTWAGSASGEETVVDDGRGLPVGADWVHLSSADGYLSLSQADWLDHGIHSPASGPPRFVHVGFALDTLDPVVSRLDARCVPHRLVSSSLGRQVYLHDCDGDPHVGYNVELVEYAPEAPRSGAVGM